MDNDIKAALITLLLSIITLVLAWLKDTHDRSRDEHIRVISKRSNPRVRNRPKKKGDRDSPDK